MNNDNRTHYIFVSKNAYETFPVPQELLDNRGPLYFPAVDEAEPVELSPLNATLKDAWEVYKGTNAEKLLKCYQLVENDKPVVVDYVDADYVSFGLDSVSMKEILGMNTAFQQVPDAVYVPALTHQEILEFQNTGYVEVL